MARPVTAHSLACAHVSWRARTAVAPALAAALLLVGCGGGGDDQAATVPASTPSESDTRAAGEASASPDAAGESPAEESPTEDQPDPDDATITAEQAQAALPTVADLPSGWSIDPEATVTSDDDEEDQSTVTPAECQPVLDGLEEMNANDPAVRAAADFTRAALGPFLGVEISSYAEDLPDDQFEKTVAAFTTCSSFTSTEPDGTTATFNAQPLSFPDLGEQTLAMRLSGESDGYAFGFDAVVIRVDDRTLVSIGQIAIGGAADPTVLEPLARTTLDRLAEAR